MDNRPFILGAALLFVVVSFAVLVTSLVGRSRQRKVAALESAQDAWHSPSVPSVETVDTSLEGLTLEVAPDSPSAALLTPLRTGDWQPPKEPAPAAHLPAVSLAERTKGYHPPGVKAAQASGPPVETSPAHALRLANLPDVRPKDDTPVAAALPTLVPVVAEHRPELPSSEFIWAPAPESVSATEPAPAPEPAAPEPEPEPVTAAVPVLEPVLALAPVPEPAFAWQPLESQETSPAARDVAQPESSVEPVVSARPRAHVSAIPEGSLASGTFSGIAPPDEPASPSLASAEYVEMVAPVEMWFGDYRVGVKAGSKTHTQFRKYADVLLGDLKGAGERAR